MHTLPELPYPIDALEPHISRETLEYHHGKHHKAYFDNLNKLIAGTEFENKNLLEIVQLAPKGPIYNNAAQAWNHILYFAGMAPAGTTKISSEFSDALTERWGSVENFQKAFKEKALANFGSGWTWLAINDKGNLEIINTDDADTVAIEPLFTAIIGCDIWEHSYYIDYRNNRGDYIDHFFQVLNWEKASELFASRK